jgi:hypothetical protein
MSFTQKLLSVTVQLATNAGTGQPNTFAESGTSTVTLSGSRISVRIKNAGASVNCRATVKVYGMTQSLMNQLTTLGMVYNQVTRNQLTIQAGDANGGLSTIFGGTIISATPDFSAQPNVPFIFEVLSGLAQATTPATVSSYQGTVNVADVVSSLATAMGFQFENNGVTAQISSPSLTGSFLEQAKDICAHANVKLAIINGTTLSIFPDGGNRNTPNVPTISPENGMISYPSLTTQGIIVKTLFNPQITMGSLIKVNSSLLSGISGAQPTSNYPSQWAVRKVDLDLDSLYPKGEWAQTLYAYNPGFARSILPPVT